MKIFWMMMQGKRSDVIESIKGVHIPISLAEVEIVAFIDGPLKEEKDRKKPARERKVKAEKVVRTLDEQEFVMSGECREVVLGD